MKRNENQVNLMKHAWKKIPSIKLAYLWRVLSIWDHCVPVAVQKFAMAGPYLAAYIL